MLLCRRFFVILTAVSFLTRCKVSTHFVYYQILRRKKYTE
nr:MAG TPA: hypothetical protein [Bacteriophage sp.]